MNFRICCSLLGLSVLVCEIRAAESRILALPVATSNSLPIAQVKQPQPLSAEKLTDPVQILGGFSNGIVHVIVNLVPPEAVARTDFSSRNSRETLHPQIRKRQQEVLDTL